MTTPAYRPGFRKLTRIADNVEILVNIHQARIIEPINGGIRIIFDSQPADRVEVRLPGVQLNALPAEWGLT